MKRGMKWVLIALLAVLTAVAAAAGGATLYLKDRIHSPEYCANCHVVAPYYKTWQSSVFKVNVVCQDCHRRTVRDGLRELVSTATGHHELPLQDRSVDRDTCLRCHGSDEAIAARTQQLIGPDGFALGRNPHDSHWGPLECATCHRMHQASQDFCANCHRFPADGPAWNSSVAWRRLTESDCTISESYFSDAQTSFPRSLCSVVK